MSIRAWLVRRKIYAAFRKPTINKPLQERLGHFPKALDAVSRSFSFNPEGKATLEPAPDYPGDSEFLTALGAAGDKVIFYSHGGGYRWGHPKDFRDLAWRLSRETGARVFLLDYPLAPKVQAPQIVDAALEAYLTLIKTVAPENVILSGDSAGGGLSLALALRLKAGGHPMPAGLSLISPWLDVTGTSKSARENWAKDAMLDGEALALGGRAYAGDLDLQDPEVSPLFGDLAGLPPILAQAGSTEVLRDDTVRLGEKVCAAGGVVQADIWKNMHHDWHMSAAVIPEGRRAIRDMAKFMQKCWSGTWDRAA